MPSFEIPDGPTTLALKPEAGLLKGVAVFGVTNKTGEGLTARFSVQVQGDGKAEWYQVQGEPERPVAAGETQTITVVAKIPATAPAGQHRIKLRAVNVNDTDNDITDSSASVVTIPAPPPSKKPNPKPFPWWILAVVGGVLVVVIGVIIAVVVMSGPKVPKVIGMDYAAAVAELKKHGGYTAAPQIDEPSPDKPLGKVFKQEPEAGKKADPKKVQVKLTVAAAATVAVPSVTGMDYTAAVAALEKSGFKAAPAINEISPTNTMGLVFKQDPAADAQADPKTVQVKLTVAVGETVTVPTITGKPYIAAQALLQDRGFTVARVVGQASGQQPDFVLTQSPAAETTAPKGSAVTLTIDPGVVVPDLLNPQVDGIAGIRALQAAGLDIGTIGSTCRAPVGKILGQSIEARTKVAKGTKVNITIGSAPSTGDIRIRCAVRPDILDFANRNRLSTSLRQPGTVFRVN
uniref:PASTA domain containing protein n=1 Tax=Caulobacter sp. (strain K31) TaxID=366602 RepID=B0T1E2_CAUSK